MAKPLTPAQIKEARERWQRCDEAEDAQRKRMLLAKQFRAGDQWPAEIKIQRAGGQAQQGMPAQPPRPMLTIDRLSQPVRLVSNQIRTANFAMDVHPNGHGADDETADIFKGILRRMQNQARAESPIEWAADQAIEGGLGWFRLRTEWVDQAPADHPGPDAFDQELRLERIPNNLSVYCDPDALKPTKSDAKFMFVTEDISREEFKRRYKNASLDSLDDFMSTGDPGRLKDWVNQDTIRIAEYWRVTYETDTLCYLADGSIVWAEQAPEGHAIARTRKVQRPKVQGSIISATQDLEQMDWLGTRIPLFPILGEEININGTPIYRGIIEEGMDAQRMVNYTYSGAMEIFALAPKSPFVVAEGQLEGYEALWQNANRYNYAYLPYKPTTLLGNVVSPPQRDVAEPPIQAAVELMRISEEAIKSTTGIHDPGLGNTNPREKSGRAIMALQRQGELGSSNYSDNVARALIEAASEALIIVPQITRPGQILQILGIDDEPQKVMVGVPYVEQPGQDPQPRPDMPPENAKLSKGLTKFYDLTKGRYAVTCAVGKSYTTKREEGVAWLSELVEKQPELMQMVGDILFRDSDLPGAQELSERMKKLMPPQLQEGEDGQPDPQVQALQAQVQQLQQAIESKLAEEQAKQQAIAQRELAKANLDAQIDLQKEQLRAEVEIQKARISAQTQVTVAEIKAGSEQAGHQVAREEQLIGNDQELRVQAIDHEHEEQMADKQAVIAASQAEQAQSHALEQQANQPEAEA